MTDQPSLTRRSFLGIALGTMPLAATTGGLFAFLWPRRAKKRPVAEPYLLCFDDGRVWDPDQELYCVRPTLREVLEVAWDRSIGYLDGEELEECLRASFLERNGDLDPEEDAEEFEAAFAEFLADVIPGIDDPLPEDGWTFEYDQWLDGATNTSAHDTWDLFPPEILDETGLVLVEGACPGSNFYGVRYDGTVEELNDALVRAGVNIVVEERSMTELD